MRMLFLSLIIIVTIILGCSQKDKNESTDEYKFVNEKYLANILVRLEQVNDLLFALMSNSQSTFSYSNAFFLSAILSSNPWPLGPVSSFLSRKAKTNPKNPRLEKIHIPAV